MVAQDGPAIFTALYPKSLPMRSLCFFLFLALPLFVSAQTHENFVDFQTAGEIEGFKLYPNPASGSRIYVVSESGAPKKIVVYNVFKEVVLTDRITDDTVDISRLLPGVYVLQVTEGRHTAVRKLIVK